MTDTQPKFQDKHVDHTRLSGQQREQLQSALINAFPNTASLEQMLAHELEKNLRAIAGEGSLQEIVFKLIQTANAEEWVEDLVRAACDSNPGNRLLKAVAEGLLLADNIQKLLKPYEQEISICVKRAYQACSPDDWPNPLPDKLEGILTELTKMPQGQSKYTVIEKFIARLVLDSEMPQSTSQQLRRWAKTNISGYSELLNVIQTQKEESKNQNSYLIVVVRRSEQDSSSNPNKEDCYFVDAWIIPDGSTYNYQNISGCKQLVYSQNVRETKQSKVKIQETLTRMQIREAIIFFVNQIGEYSPSKLIIEIFLPLDLINEPVDSLERKNEFEPKIMKLNTDYKIVVRSTERTSPNYLKSRKGIWQDKWKMLQNIIKKSVLSAFVLSDDYDSKNLLLKLKQENIIGIKLQKTPIQTESVFGVILRGCFKSGGRS